MRRIVEVAPGRTGVRAGSLRSRINAHRPHLSHVDHQATVIRSEPRPAMPTAPHRQIQPILTGEPNRRHNVAHLLRPQHRKRAPVKHAVMHGPRRVVALILSHYHAPAHLLAEASNSLSNTVFHRDICHCGPPALDDYEPAILPLRCRCVKRTRPCRSSAIKKWLSGSPPSLHDGWATDGWETYSLASDRTKAFSARSCAKGGTGQVVSTRPSWCLVDQARFHSYDLAMSEPTEAADNVEQIVAGVWHWSIHNSNIGGNVSA